MMGNIIRDRRVALAVIVGGLLCVAVSGCDLREKPLDAPTHLFGNSDTSEQADLWWAYASTDCDIIHIERSPTGQDGWEEVARIGAGETTYKDSGLACGMTYYYRLRGSQSSTGKYSPYTPAVSVTTIPCVAEVESVVALISPLGSITSGDPVFSWNAFGDSVLYRLVVEDSLGNPVISQQHAAPDFCADAVCSAPSPVTLPDGTYTWRVQGLDATDVEWSSEEKTFTVDTQGAGPSAKLVGPSGFITTEQPTFVWEAVEDASWYLLVVSGATGNLLEKRYNAPDVCDGLVCSIMSSVALPIGSFTWKIQTGMLSGDTVWSGEMSFVYNPPGIPGPVVLVSPNGALTTANPTYTWRAAEGATSYNLRVDGATGTIISEWFETADVCSAGTCSVKHGVVLKEGEYTWQVRSRSSAGDGPWSGTLNFTVSTSPSAKTPNAVLLISPNGVIGTNRPTYKWTDVGNATSYYLSVNGPDGSAIGTWYAASDVCANDVCVIRPDVYLKNSDYNWMVVARNKNGEGPWSTPVNFTVGAQPSLAAPEPLKPRGPTDTVTPTYSWEEVVGAEGYSLRVVDANNKQVFEKLYMASSICKGGRCATTPSQKLTSGTYTWYVRSWTDMSGYGDWNYGLSFTIPKPPDAKAVQVSPVGTITVQKPTYTWKEVERATTYRLWVGDASDKKIIDMTYDAAAICQSGTCKVQPNLALASGSYKWYVRASNGAGAAPWSNGLSFTVPPSADLALTMSDSPDPVAPGNDVTYILVVTNGGPDGAQSAVLTQNLPAGVTYVSATPSVGSCGESGGVVTCNLGNIANGGSATVTVVITTGGVGTITSTASVTSSTSDPNAGNNDASEDTSVATPLVVYVGMKVWEACTSAETIRRR